MKRDDIGSMLISLGRVYQDFSLDEDVLNVYRAVLSDVDIHAVKTACLKYMRKGKRFPTPADIIELVDLDA